MLTFRLGPSTEMSLAFGSFQSWKLPMVALISASIMALGGLQRLPLGPSYGNSLYSVDQEPAQGFCQSLRLFIPII